MEISMNAFYLGLAIIAVFAFIAYRENRDAKKWEQDGKKYRQ